jgi:glutamine---fructose-6-phosphate transaminase (isomerizing)
MERNANSHVSGDISVVHAGIVENRDEMRALLTARGYAFASDTDTEAHMFMENGDCANYRGIAG